MTSNPAVLPFSPCVAIRPVLVSSVRTYLSMPAVGDHHPQMCDVGVLLDLGNTSGCWADRNLCCDLAAKWDREHGFQHDRC